MSKKRADALTMFPGHPALFVNRKTDRGARGKESVTGNVLSKDLLMLVASCPTGQTIVTLPARGRLRGQDLKRRQAG